MDFSNLLKIAKERRASDIFITAGLPPSMKINGELIPVSDEILSAELANKLIFLLMNKQQKDEFMEKKECNFAINNQGLGRFRISAFFQRNTMGMVLRRIETQIPSLESLKLPKVVQDFSLLKRGLILFIGATGSGKSTTLASLIDHRNSTSQGHIISIEDPIEYIHKHKKSMITQREVGVDTESFEVALQNTLRQAPDVIVIGEVRTKEAMTHAIAFSETGHLCLATLHANNAYQALDRIAHFFPNNNRGQLWMELSLNLKAIVGQTLVPKASGKGRALATEILTNSPLMSDYIRKGNIHDLKAVMKKSKEYGMLTFDESLLKLLKNGEITEKVALSYSDSPNDLRLMIHDHIEDDTVDNGSEHLDLMLDVGEEEKNRYNLRRA